MRGLLWCCMAVLCLLVGCDGSGYQRKSGGWTYDDVAFSPSDPATFQAIDPLFARDALRGYYRGSEVVDSDGKSFEALSEHEARDHQAVYYCDTYRKGQEYWTVRHLRVERIHGADAPTYTVLGQAYARDRRQVYFEGTPFSVRDAASFVPLEAGFAHDAQVAYFERREIRGSHGPSLVVIDAQDSSYVRDRAKVYYGYTEVNTPNQGPHPVVRTLHTPDPAAVRVLGRAYAADARQVWYRGALLAGADPASFVVSTVVAGEADAHDRYGAWGSGKRVADAPVSAATR